MPRLAFMSAPRRLVALVEVSGSTESKIDRHEHQSRAMRDRHGEGPEPQLRRSYSRQRPRMAPVDEAEAERQAARIGESEPVPHQKCEVGAPC